jgi:hypothetical protein
MDQDEIQKNNEETLNEVDFKEKRYSGSDVDNLNGGEVKEEVDMWGKNKKQDETDNNDKV